MIIIKTINEYSFFNCRGPDGAVIFYRKNVCNAKSDQEIACKIEERINQAVSRLQDCSYGTIAAIAAAMKNINTPQFVEYQKHLVKNTKELSQILSETYTILMGENMHFVVIDLHLSGINADQAEKVFNAANISCTKCYLPEDNSFNPYGIKLGMATLTTHKSHLSDEDFDKITKFIHKGNFTNLTRSRWCSITSIVESENNSISELLHLITFVKRVIWSFRALKRIENQFDS